MLAIFDLDETLIGVDCASVWSQYMVDMGWASSQSFLDAEERLMEEYRVGNMDMGDYMLFLLQPLIGKQLDMILDHGKKFAQERIVQHMYANAKQRIDAYLAEGTTVIIVSASPEFIVKPIARLFGVEHVLAIDIETSETGEISGKTKGTLTYREGKVTRLTKWLEARPEDMETASFYSDSYNDLALLEKVGLPNVVNPDSRLAEKAAQSNWPVLNWA